LRIDDNSKESKINKTVSKDNLINNNKELSGEKAKVNPVDRLKIMKSFSPLNITSNKVPPLT
jgi:hypothetical protein